MCNVNDDHMLLSGLRITYRRGKITVCAFWGFENLRVDSGNRGLLHVQYCVSNTVVKLRQCEWMWLVGGVLGDIRNGGNGDHYTGRCVSNLQMPFVEVAII